MSRYYNAITALALCMIIASCVSNRKYLAAKDVAHHESVELADRLDEAEARIARLEMISIDSNGLKDTDGDGVPDNRDKELITPTECQPVDADGVGKCPCHCATAALTRSPAPDVDYDGAPDEPTVSQAPHYTQHKPGYTIVPVFYGTGRKRSKQGYYGAEANSYNTFGIINVSIPDGHKPGQMERPGTFESLFGNVYNPMSYVETGKNSLMTEPQFYSALRSALATCSKGETFIFIHGYNSSFSDAARKTAQLFYDMKYAGVPIMYSWPSMGSVKGYGYDGEQTASVGNVTKLAQFLADVVKNSGGKSISIVAHSMGNRLLTNALLNFTLTHPGVRFNHIIMAAPDVYRQDFGDYGVAEMLKVCRDVTLYASSHDHALSVSDKVHAGIARLGQAGKGIFVKPPVCTIDISSVPCTDMLGHSCYSVSKSVIQDIALALDDVPAEGGRRMLVKVPSGGERNWYWKFPAMPK